MRILLVDDDRDFLDLLSHFLGRYMGPCTIVCTQSPQEAIGHLEAEDADILVSDFDLPDKNGLELLDVARRHCLPHMSFIVSSHNDRMLECESLRRGAMFCLDKGTGIRSIAQFITFVIDNADAISTNQGVMVVRMGRIVHVNEQMLSRMNYAYEDLVGQHCMNVLASDCIPYVREVHRELHRGASIKLPCRLHDRKGARSMPCTISLKLPKEVDAFTTLHQGHVPYCAIITEK